MNMRRPLNRGRQLSSLEPIWPPGSSHYGGGARIEPLWRGSPHQGQTPHETVRRGRKFHFLTLPSPSGVSQHGGETSRPPRFWHQLLLQLLLQLKLSCRLSNSCRAGRAVLPSSPQCLRQRHHPTAATKCEGPDGHPTLFGRLRLDWVVLLGRRVQEMVAFI